MPNVREDEDSVLGSQEDTRVTSPSHLTKNLPDNNNRNNMSQTNNLLIKSSQVTVSQIEANESSFSKKDREPVPIGNFGTKLNCDILSVHN